MTMSFMRSMERKEHRVWRRLKKDGKGAYNCLIVLSQNNYSPNICRDHGDSQSVEIDYGVGGNFAFLRGAQATIGYQNMNCRRPLIPFILICQKKEGAGQSNDGGWV